MEEELLKPKQAARLLGVSTWTLRSWARKGLIRAVELPSGRYVYPRSEILRIMKKRAK